MFNCLVLVTGNVNKVLNYCNYFQPIGYLETSTLYKWFTLNLIMNISLIKTIL